MPQLTATIILRTGLNWENSLKIGRKQARINTKAVGGASERDRVAGADAAGGHAPPGGAADTAPHLGRRLGAQGRMAPALEHLGACTRLELLSLWPNRLQVSGAIALSQPALPPHRLPVPFNEVFSVCTKNAQKHRLSASTT